MRKNILGIATSLLAGAAIMTSVSASTVTNPYNGHQGSWNRGHDWRVIYTYSETASSYYSHSASVDSTMSGIKGPGTVAHAEKIGGTAYYWWIV